MEDNSSKSKGGLDLSQHVDAFLKASLDLEGAITASSAVIREKSKMAYDHALLDSRLSLIGVFASLLGFRTEVPGITNERISEVLNLIVVFVQGATVTEALISEGQYIKAAAVLKQDLELLARIREVQKGVAKYGKTPDVKHTEHMRRFYGELNNVAHIAKIDLLQQLISKYEDGSVKGVSPIPAFNKAVAINLYQLHILLLFEIAREAFILTAEMYPSDTEDTVEAIKHWLATVARLEEAGVFKILK